MPDPTYHAGYDPLTAPTVFYVDPDGGGTHTTIEAAWADIPLTAGKAHATVFLKDTAIFAYPLIPWINGLDADHPFYLGSYGTPGGRATLLGVSPGKNIAGTLWITKDQTDVVIDSIRWYTPAMDWTNPANDNAWTRSVSLPGGLVGKADGLNLAPKAGGVVRRVSVRYCEMAFTGFNATGRSLADPVGSISDVVIWRNLFHHNWITGGERAQGINSYRFPCNLLSNVFYHCGHASNRDLTPMWTVDSRGRTVTTANIYNHSYYFSGAVNFESADNVSIHPSSIHYKHRGLFPDSSPGVNVHDNLAIGGEVGIGFTGQDNDGVSGETAFRCFPGALIDDNTIVRVGQPQPGTRKLSFGLYIEEIVGGHIRRNVFVGPSDPAIVNVRPVAMDGPIYSTTLADNTAVSIPENKPLIDIPELLMEGSSASWRSGVNPGAVESLLPGGGMHEYAAMLLGLNKANWDAQWALIGPSPVSASIRNVVYDGAPPLPPPPPPPPPPAGSRKARFSFRYVVY